MHEIRNDIILASLQEVVNVTETYGVYVQVRAGIDITNQEATWEFQTIDPQTGSDETHLSSI